VKPFHPYLIIGISRTRGDGLGGRERYQLGDARPVIYKTERFSAHMGGRKIVAASARKRAVVRKTEPVAECW